MQNPQDIVQGVPVNQPIQGHAQHVMQGVPVQNQLIPSIIRIIKKVIPFAIVGGIGYISGRDEKKDVCFGVDLESTSHNVNDNHSALRDHGQYTMLPSSDIEKCFVNIVHVPSVVSFCNIKNTGDHSYFSGKYLVSSIIDTGQVPKEKEILDNEEHEHVKFTTTFINLSKEKKIEADCETIKRF